MLHFFLTPDKLLTFVLSFIATVLKLDTKLFSTVDFKLFASECNLQNNCLPRLISDEWWWVPQWQLSHQRKIWGFGCACLPMLVLLHPHLKVTLVSIPVDTPEHGTDSYWGCVHVCHVVEARGSNVISCFFLNSWTTCMFCFRRPMETEEDLLVFIWSSGSLEFFDASPDLQPFSYFQYRVQAQNSKGSVLSHWASARTLQAKPKNMPPPSATPTGEFSLAQLLLLYDVDIILVMSIRA